MLFVFDNGNILYYDSKKDISAINFLLFHMKKNNKFNWFLTCNKYKYSNNQRIRLRIKVMNYKIQSCKFCDF